MLLQKTKTTVTVTSMSAESISRNGELNGSGGVIKIQAPDGLRAVQDNSGGNSGKRPFISCAPENMSVPFFMIVNFPDQPTPSTVGRLPYVDLGWKTDISRTAAATLVRRIGAEMDQPYYHAWPTDFVSPNADRLGLMEGESTDLADVVTDTNTLIGVIDGDTVERVQWVKHHEDWRTSMIGVVTERAIYDSFISGLIEETVAEDERENILAALPAMQEFYRQYVETDDQKSILRL